MSGGRMKTIRDPSSVSDRLVITFFFAAGAALAFFGASAFPSIEKPRLFWSALMTAVLLFSISMAGGVLLPLCSLSCGAFVEQGALNWIAEMDQEVSCGFRVPVSGIVLVSVFFLAAVHGLTVSAAIQTAAQRGSPTAREIYRQELPLVFLFALAALAAAFYFY